MGGIGSGRWRQHQKKVAVEACLTLDVSGLLKPKSPGQGSFGTINWADRASVSFALRQDGPEPTSTTLELSYRLGDQELRQMISFETTRLHFGNRLWFKCPKVSANGDACGRRVGKLYLPPGARYFGCRGCHRLIHRSAQEHDKRIASSGSLFAGLLEGKDVNLNLLVKALALT